MATAGRPWVLESRGVSPIPSCVLDGQDDRFGIRQLKKTSHRWADVQSTLSTCTVHTTSLPSFYLYHHRPELKKMKTAFLGSLAAVAATVMANDQYEHESYQEVIPE